MPRKFQKFPEFHELSTKQQEILNKTYNFSPGSSSGQEIILLGDKRYVFAKKFQTDGDEYLNFEGKSDDVWVFTFPRSGTTWTVEMLWLLMNDLDYNEAFSKTASTRIPYFE